MFTAGPVPGCLCVHLHLQEGHVREAVLKVREVAAGRVKGDDDLHGRRPLLRCQGGEAPRQITLRPCGDGDDDAQYGI